MKRILVLFILPVIVISLGGCAKLTQFRQTTSAKITEFSKVMWGSSTKRLEIERKNSISKTFACGYDACFNAVLELCTKSYLWKIEDWDFDEQEDIQKQQQKAAKNKAKTDALLLHLKNREKKHIVVVNVPDAVDTTEVGIFFVPLDQKTVKVELSSLSTKAKRNASELVFNKLGQYFQEVNRD